ncbi:Cys/Met metabolism, pyridoxal phosphate-dependent enzyme [Cynara cardunculus var. scolymus]|uniref:Cys/Met metabolism, pyridoxal phosphate-dependent enzyme n=1 Tax=Cynara cardunculus var. scolymus TaxID=59895 RepID=A0A118JUM1_CYNCS|nr:Cys/Met metabolism, pyridoxal phosphate-dependent enzyme [Cynara cardunculus var. scolymus]
MALSSCASRVSLPFECRSDPDFSGGIPRRDGGRFFCKLGGVSGNGTIGMSLILRFPPNFVRQLSNKARRNCSNIGVAQIVAASWSNNQPISSAAAGGKAVDAAASSSAVSAPIVAGEDVVNNNDKDLGSSNGSPLVQFEALENVHKPSFLKSDGSVAIHAGERLGRGIVTDAITTPVVNTSAYFFKKTGELIDFKEKRHTSFEYGRYGNPTTVVAEEKISALEGAESTLLLASGMCASTVMMLALVPAGGHIITTTDCYRKTRIFIETVLPKMGITATVIDPADIAGLEAALDNHKVSLFFTESPTNPFLRCVDIELVSKLCRAKGAIVCIDGTFATPLNQKALALGADIVLHSATKYIGGHNDNAAYLIIRGMKTLHLRIQQQNSTAQRMAEVLEAHPKVKHVYYPGLQSHPEHHIAKKQMLGFGGVVIERSFECLLLPTSLR